MPSGATLAAGRALRTVARPPSPSATLELGTARASAGASFTPDAPCGLQKLLRVGALKLPRNSWHVWHRARRPTRASRCTSARHRGIARAGTSPRSSPAHAGGSAGALERARGRWRRRRTRRGGRRAGAEAGGARGRRQRQAARRRRRRAAEVLVGGGGVAASSTPSMPPKFMTARDIGANLRAFMQAIDARVEALHATVAAAAGGSARSRIKINRPRSMVRRAHGERCRVEGGRRAHAAAARCGGGAVARRAPRPRLPHVVALVLEGAAALARRALGHWVNRRRRSASSRGPTPPARPPRAPRPPRPRRRADAPPAPRGDLRAVVRPRRDEGVSALGRRVARTECSARHRPSTRGPTRSPTRVRPAWSGSAARRAASSTARPPSHRRLARRAPRWRSATPPRSRRPEDDESPRVLRLRRVGNAARGRR